MVQHLYIGSPEGWVPNRGVGTSRWSNGQISEEKMGYTGDKKMTYGAFTIRAP